MRKLLLCLLSLLILASLTVPAFAESVSVPSNPSSIVTVTVSSTKPKNYKVDIDWGNMSFTYDFGELTWDVTNHQYVAKAPKGWGNKTTDTIKVTNHSNAVVYATPSISQSNVSGVNASLNTTAKTPVGSAEDGSAKNVSFTLTIGGTPPISTTGQTLTSHTVKITLSAS